MEGLIPFVYKAIMQYKNGKEGLGSWICDSPSYSYMRLSSGESVSFSASSPSSNSSSSTTTQMIVVSSGVQSPHHHCLTHRRIAA